MEPTASRSPRALAADLLTEQGDLSAVARFARWHESHEAPAQAPLYRDLIPLTAPLPGQQFAFEVDLDKCSGCKACVSACHSLNGLDDGEAWREVGLLVSDDWRHPFQQTVTTACHHCVDPGCLNGCPVLAYDKDPLTGLVRHLDDQCIGCQYCVFKCPYDAPKYSERRGIVRKCDMCSNRLAAGEAPACVQACPNKAIRITLVDTRSLALQYRDRAEDRFLPGAPPSEYTLPTTRYTSAKPLPPLLRAADREELRPQPAHTPLVFMLVFSQLSAGLFAFEFLLRFLTPSSVTLSASAALTFAACVAGVFAMGVGGLHLGRPLGAWRSFLGLRRSWLSREIVAFGVFLPLAALHTVSVRFPEWTSAGVSLALAAATVFTGLLGVFCSAMVYHDTRREFWWLPATAGKFFGSVLLLGAGGTLLVLAAFAWPGSRGVCLALSALLPLAGMCKLAVELRVLRHLPDDDFSSLHKTALLLTERFGLLHRTRVTCLVMGAVVLPAWIAIEIGGNGQASHSAHTLTLQAAVAFLFCLAGELIERRLFFTAVQPVKMPGAIVA